MRPRFGSSGHAASLGERRADHPWARILVAALMIAAGGVSSLRGTEREPVETWSLLPAMNRGFRDAVAGDGQGGWTDQGPDNDLSALRPGALTAAGVTFTVQDPVTKGGHSALVLGAASQKVAHDAGEAARGEAATSNAAASLTEASIRLDRTSPVRYLYLLHACANPPAAGAAVGSLIVRYADGTVGEQPVRYRTDIGNWRDPAPAVNAGVAWEGENPTATIGLYASRFAVEPKAIAAVTFKLAGTAPWMIVALSASNQQHEVGVVAKGLTITAGEEWGPYAHSLDTAAGSALDFSLLLDAPAGKHGALRATPEGHFEFTTRPGHRVRFWGVNLCFTAQYLEKDEAELLAQRLARSGYNAVRLHHFDAELVRGGRNSWDLNADALDRLDYLFAALKRRGIYLNIDLYSTRPFSADEVKAWGLPAAARTQFKSLLPLNDGAFESWKRYATNLLSHRNPYTGLTWAEDPALVGICPVNENPLFNRVETPDDVAALYAAAYARTGQAGPARATNPAFNAFIHALNRESDARMAAHLRSLGSQALLTGANYTISQGLTFVREQYDYVDCHSYWDHPKFPVKAWALPIAFGQGSSVRARAKMPNRIMPTRVFGRPFVSTEFNFCRPNQYRFEGAILMPAYASLQDWDALFNFQYAMSRSMAIHGGVDNYFAIANDPIGLMADRLGSLLFQRGDIAPARNAVAYAVQPEEAYAALGRLFPGEFSPLGLVVRIGSLTGSPAEITARANPAWRIAALVTGDTGGAAIPPPTVASDTGRAGTPLPAGLGAERSPRPTLGTSPESCRADLGRAANAPASGNIDPAGHAQARPYNQAVSDVRASTPSALRTYAMNDALPVALQRAGVLPAHAIEPASNRYVSDTGQIDLQAEAGLVRVVTPASELFIAAPGARLEGRRVTVTNGATRGALAVVALPTQTGETVDLATARRVLVVQLTDALPRGMRFAHEDRKLLETWGKGPQLLRRGDATLELDLPNGPWKAWALDATGARAREIPLQARGKRLVLAVSTVTPAGAQLAYELSR